MFRPIGVARPLLGLGGQRRIGIVGGDPLVVVAGGPVFGPPVVILGQKRQPFGLFEAYLGRGPFDVLALPLALLREGPPHLLDDLFGFVERGAGVKLGKLQTASEMKLDDAKVQQALRKRFAGTKLDPNETVVTPDSIFNDEQLVEIEWT